MLKNSKDEEIKEPFLLNKDKLYFPGMLFKRFRQTQPNTTIQQSED